jgi:hypothetical protein
MKSFNTKDLDNKSVKNLEKIFNHYAKKKNVENVVVNEEDDDFKEVNKITKEA